MSVFPVASDSVTLDTAQVETTDVWANGFRINPVTNGVRASFSNTVSTYNQGVPLDANGVVCLVDSTASLPSSTWNNGIPLSNQKMCLSSAAVSTYSNGLPMAANGGVGGLLVPSMSLYFLGTASLDSRITFTRADAVTGTATAFDSTGRLVQYGANLVLNSVLAGGTSGVEGSTAVAPTNWQFAANTGSVVFSGTRCQFIASTQRPFLQATNTVGTGTFVFSAVVEALGAATTIIDVIGIAPGTATIGAVTFLRNGSSVSGTVSVAVGDRVTAVTTVSVGGTILSRFGLGCNGNTTGDITMSSPQLEQSSVAYAYSPTQATATSGPRFDYDPASPAGVTGPELVTNGDFSQGSTGWTASPGTQVSQLSGSAWRIASTDGSAASVAQTALTPTAGKTYRITLEIVSTSGSGLLVDFGGATSPALTTIGIKTFDLKCSNTVALVVKRGGVCDSVFDNISVQEVTFNPRGLLIEESRQNLLLQSRDMTTASWTKTDVTPTRNQVGIDGTANSACLMTEGSAGTALLFQTATVTAGATITGSFVLKRGNNDWFRIGATDGSGNGGLAYFNLSTGAAGTVTNSGTGTSSTSSITNLGGGWYRCTVTSIPSGAYTAAKFEIQSATANGNATRVSGATYIVDCAQLEVGAFATSIIPTTTTALTRAADSASMTGTNFSSWFNASAGTFVGEAYRIDQTATSRMVVSADNGTTDERIEVRYSGSTGTNVRFEVVDGTVSQVSIIGGTGSNSRKLAFAYALNDFAGVLNGVVVGTDASGTLPTPTQLQIGKASFANGELNGWISRLTYYPSRLANATLQALTT